MRWEITTAVKTYVVSAFSSNEAISKVKQVDNSEVNRVRILPKNTLDKVKSVFYSWSKKL